jgi:CRISPR-associated protein Cpf1
VNSFGDIKGKQRGVLFYTRANYTSITDPVSGRRRHLYFSKKTGEEMRKQVVSFTAMGYDEKKSEFFFTYNPAHFSAEGKGLSKEWTLWSGVERWRKKRDEHGIWADEKVKDITEALRNLFTTYGITLSNDILSQIREKADLEAKFYSELLWLLEIIMQIRNTDNQKNDFILSPIEVGGKKFDSREYYERTKQTVH